MSSTSSTSRCANCAILRKEIELLKAQVADLKTALEERWRSGKRQAAPFRKKKKKNPKSRVAKEVPALRDGEHAHRQALASPFSVPDEIPEGRDG